jgi:serine/threonine-protein kinase
MSIPEAGDTVGKYRLLKMIGQGGMASVYLAVDEDLNREVAIKILHAHLQSRRDARRRFRREAQSVARLTHRNILTIYDYSGEDAKTSFIVTQFIRGPQLKQMSDKTGSFPHEVVAAMAKQVTDGLMVAHGAGIVHRDVKPENILIDEGGVLKIADFGIALLADTQEMTATGQILGSPYYMSPEHVLGKGLDARADVFSFGSLLYWMVTSRQAFQGPNPHAVLKRIVEGEVEPVERIAPAAGQAMGRIVRTCHIRDRDERPSNLEPISEMLDRYMQMSGIEDPVEEVRNFLDSPDTYLDLVKPRTIKALMREGDSCRKEGKTPAAMDAYNRVLTLEPENTTALRRVKEVASARSRRRLATRLGVLVLASLLVVAVVFWGPRLLASLGWNSEPQPIKAAVEEPDRKDAWSAPAAKPDASVDELEVQDVPPPTKEQDVVVAVKKSSGTKPVKKPAGKTFVKFVPAPKSVIIWVDGKKLGSYFDVQTMELEVGKHTIRFEPEDKNCCEPAEWVVNVLPQPGGKPQMIGKRLTFYPAQLYVYSDKPARVSVDGKYVGQAKKWIDVPMKTSPSVNVTVTVSAVGYKPVSRKVLLQAGKKATLPAIEWKPEPGS